MASFKDRTGREWQVEINPWTIKQVLARTGVHLGKLIDKSLERYSDLLSDAAQLVDVLFVLCSEQAERLGVSDEDFGKSLGGEDAYEDAVAAFESAFLDFCPSRLRKVLKAAQTKGTEAADLMATRTVEKIQSLDASSLSATNSEASSASIPPG